MFSSDSESMGSGSGITGDGDLICHDQIWGEYYHLSQKFLGWGVE